MRFIAIFALLVSITGTAWAVSDVRNSSDHPLLDRFARSYIVQYKQRSEQDYRLVLGVLEKINGVLVPEKEQRLSGELSRITYRIPEGHSAGEAFQHMRSQLEAQNAEALFVCSGRGCGSSNQWANSIFRYSRLYGVDSTQHVASFRKDNLYVSLYSVQRGNKRVYLHLEVLESDQLSAMKMLEANSRVRVEGRDSELEQLVTFLNQFPEKSLWLVGVDFEPGTLSQQLERAEAHVKAFRQQLLEQGIAEGRLKWVSHGGLAPLETKRTGKYILVYSE